MQIFRRYNGTPANNPQEERIGMNIDAKIVSLDELSSKIKALKAENKKVVLAHGCFDVLHVGHIRYLETARQMGDALFVTVTPDRFVDKGASRPAFTQQIRSEVLAALGLVDAVSINNWPTAVELLQLLQPDIYVKGSDFQSAEVDPTGKLQQEAAVCAELGIELRFTQDVVFSSTNLINRFFSTFSDELQEYLAIFRKRHPLDSVLAVLDAMQSLRVFIVSDTILDEYCYCSTLGVSSKYPTVAVQRLSTDVFAGGGLAIANHVAQLAKSVDLVTILGGAMADADTEWITRHLNSAVTPHFFYAPNVETIRKLRYIERDSFTKLLEVYNCNSASVDKDSAPGYTRAICDLARKNDFTIAADFGHGAITAEQRNALVSMDTFLAVNTQCNAGNKMMNTISNYSRADYVSITENELRRDTHDLHTHLRALTCGTARRLHARHVVATRGKFGLSLGRPDGGFFEIPAVTAQTTDTVGAGDAVFSIGAMAAYIGASAEIITFLATVAGALAVQTMGNSEPIARVNLEKWITSLLK